jgi:tryptophan synthase beta chain
VRELQSIIGREARAQILKRAGALPDMPCSPASAAAPTPSACSMPSSAIAACEIVGVEAGGRGTGSARTPRAWSYGRPGVLHGTYSLLLQDEDGQIQETTRSAGLDYPGVGPEHALLHDIGRVQYEAAATTRRSTALQECCAPRRHPAGARERARAVGARAGRVPSRQAHPRVSRVAATRTCRRCSARCWRRG